MKSLEKKDLLMNSSVKTPSIIKPGVHIMP